MISRESSTISTITFPIEIWSQIIEYLGRVDVCSMSLVCKLMSSSAQRHLWHHIDFFQEYQEADIHIARIKSSPAFGRYQTKSIHCFYHFLDKAIKQDPFFHNLQRLQLWSGMFASTVPDLSFWENENLSSLQHLELNGGCGGIYKYWPSSCAEKWSLPFSLVGLRVYQPLSFPTPFLDGIFKASASTLTYLNITEYEVFDIPPNIQFPRLRTFKLELRNRTTRESLKRVCRGVTDLRVTFPSWSDRKRALFPFEQLPQSILNLEFTDTPFQHVWAFDHEYSKFKILRTLLPEIKASLPLLRSVRLVELDKKAHLLRAHNPERWLSQNLYRSEPSFPYVGSQERNINEALWLGPQYVLRFEQEINATAVKYRSHGCMFDICWNHE